jgi:hypothetical protein
VLRHVQQALPATGARKVHAGPSLPSAVQCRPGRPWGPVPSSPNPLIAMLAPPISLLPMSFNSLHTPQPQPSEPRLIAATRPSSLPSALPKPHPPMLALLLMMRAYLRMQCAPPPARPPPAAAPAHTPAPGCRAGCRGWASRTCDAMEHGGTNGSTSRKGVLS